MNQPVMPNANYLGGQRRRISEDSLQGLGFSQPKHISRNGGRFTLVDETGVSTPVPTFDPQIGVYVDVVLVDTNPVKSKIYFDPANEYDPNDSNPPPPLCFSDNGTAPSINAIQPQSPLCAQCPQNRKGSAISKLTGEETWACKDQKKFAVLVSGFQGLWQFVVPPASLKKYRAYAEWVVKQQLPGAGRNADVADMITRVYFEAGKPNVLEFRAVGLITPQIAQLQDQIWASGEADAIVGKTDQPRQGMLPTPGQPQQYLPPQPQGFVQQPQQTHVPPPPPPPPPAPPPPQGHPVGPYPGDGRPVQQPQQSFVGPQPQVPQQPAQRRNKPKPGQQQGQPLTLQQPGAAPQQGFTQQPGGSGPANIAPSAGFQSTGMAPASTPGAIPVQGASPSNYPAPNPNDPLDVPGFLDRRVNPNAPPPPPAPQQPQQAQFGIAPNAPPPPASIASAVNDAFKLA